jgi:HAMP domain-containing protein
VAVLLLAFGIIGFVSTRLEENNFHIAVRNASRPLTTTSARLLFNPLYTLNITEIDGILSQYVDNQIIVFAAVYDVTGKNVSQVTGTWVPDSTVSSALAKSAMAQDQLMEQEADSYLLIVTPIGVEGQIIGAVEFAFDQSAMRTSMGATQSKIIFMIAAMMLGTALLFFFLIRIVVLPLARLAASAQKIGAGDFSVPIQIEGVWEVASLAMSLEKMRSELLEGYFRLQETLAGLEQRVAERTAVAEHARAEAESARNGLEAQVWLANGQTRLMDVMRSEQTISQLAENVLYHLCRYMGVHAGALFLLNSNTLTLAGTYAYTARPGFEGSFALGEGLVGQAAADGKVIYEQVPSDTLIISTGLADIKPRQIAAVPFYMNEKVIGVLELATLSEFTPIHLELWQRITETLGSAFHTVQTRQKLAELLMASQRQAEELQVQEEELRTANEELQAQAESLRSSSKVQR